RRHTRSKRDWSSDVCSSDLTVAVGDDQRGRDHADGDGGRERGDGVGKPIDRERHVADYGGERDLDDHGDGARCERQSGAGGDGRSEERRVGEGWGGRRWGGG